MAMGDDREIEFRKVDTLGCDILCENLCIIAGVEQNALVAVLNICGEPPVLFHGGGLAEGIGENRDLRRAWLRMRRWRTGHPGS